MWFLFAVLSSIFAAATSILAKLGISGVNSNLATAIRTAVVVVMSWGIVFLTNAQSGVAEIGRRSWLFLILSGLATGASWLCYYRALQIGEVSKVVPVDKFSIVLKAIPHKEGVRQRGEFLSDRARRIRRHSGATSRILRARDGGNAPVRVHPICAVLP